MRCDQYVGLPPSAREWIAKNCRQVRISTTTVRKYHDGETATSTDERSEAETHPYSHFEGMFGDKYNLHEYVKHDGSKVREFMQSDEWSSGPVFHLGLQNEHGKPLITWQQCEKCFEFHDGEHDPELCSQGVHE